MAEAHTDAYLSRPMTRAEIKLLSVDEKKERKLAKNRINNIKYRETHKEQLKEYSKKYSKEHSEEIKQYGKKYREEHPEKKKETNRKYIENNKEKEKERHKLYKQSPAGKKTYTLSNWKNQSKLQETREEMERLYELWLTQEICSSCDVKLTRTGTKCSTDACLDHSHTTNRFRQICCHSCNIMDNWKKYWVDGIFGGSKLPRPPP